MNIDSIVQQLQAQQASGGVTANAVSAKTTSATSTASTSSAGDTGDVTITADDFLTLLVTELQNQDPTQDTDPNSYINQLVDVNSLQQLISINSGIGTLDSSVDPSATTSADAVAGTGGTASPSAQVSQAQLANAQASYAAFEAAPLSTPGDVTDQLSFAQQLDSSNPAMNSQSGNAGVGPVVPSEWRTTQSVSS